MSSKQKVNVLPCRQDSVWQACISSGDTPRPREQKILIRTHTVLGKKLLWKLLTARGGALSPTRMQQPHLTLSSRETADPCACF